jgi:hypothetical protein
MVLGMKFKDSDADKFKKVIWNNEYSKEKLPI